VPIRPLISRYDTLLLDLDGCVWVGDDPTPGVAEAIAALREAGRGVAFVTNDARSSPEELTRKLWGLGIRASVEEVVTVGGAAQHVLHEEHPGRTAFVIGAPAVHRHVADAGLRVVNGTAFASRAEVVVVAAHDDFSYDELRVATQAVLRGASILATGRDPTFPMADGPWPGTGSVVAALEWATGVTARSVGKPDAQLHLTALDRLGVERPALAETARPALTDASRPVPGDPSRPAPGGASPVCEDVSPPSPRRRSRVLAVGDRLDTDVAGAHAAGIDSALVLTGATGRDEAEAAVERPVGEPRPIAVAETLAALVLS